MVRRAARVVKNVAMDAERCTTRLSDNRRSMKRNFRGVVQKFLCCACIRKTEEDVLEYNDDQEIPKPVVGEENVHIFIEDLGIDNPGFCNVDTEQSRSSQQITVGRSASSVSMCQRSALKKKKKKLAPLSSLPLQSRSGQGDLNSEGGLFSTVLDYFFSVGDRTLSSDGGLLPPPVINLIPPTPSDVLDDDQFFDMNSEEDSVLQTSGSEGVDSICSAASGEHESEEDEKLNREAESEDKLEERLEGVASEHPEVRPQEEVMAKENSKNFLRSSFQVATLPDYPRKRSLNTGICLLQFTEHNLDDLSNSDVGSHRLLKEELSLLPINSKMLLYQKKPIVRSCSLGEAMTRSHTFQSTCPQSDGHFEDEESPRQRRITVASYMPFPQEQTGELELKNSNNKTLAELNTEEVCQWFIKIGLQKCLPFIREAKFTGSHIISIDLNTLEKLQVYELEEKERLLSAIYKELHPPNSTTQRLDFLLESFGPHNVEKFTAALVSLTKSKSSPQVDSFEMKRCSFKNRENKQHSTAQRNSYLEITINASDQIVHLRTPKDTSVGKVMESCLKMLGIDENKDHFNLKSKEDHVSPELQIGDLSDSETRLMEFQLCRKEALRDLPNSSDDNNRAAENGHSKDQYNTSKIRELNQQVASLQNVMIQVQGLYHGLVAFCSELKKMEGDMDAELLTSSELQNRLSDAQDSLQKKRLSLKMLKDNLNSAPVLKKTRAEEQLLEKMKLNCQVFKEEINLVHLNRQTAHLRTALMKAQVKDKSERKSPTLTQLISLQSPVMLVATQVKANPDGHYGFSACCFETQGLIVVHTEIEGLCLNDRLVEVNGVTVLGSSEDELESLLKMPTAHIIALRQLTQSPSEFPTLQI